MPPTLVTPVPAFISLSTHDHHTPVRALHDLLGNTPFSYVQQAWPTQDNAAHGRVPVQPSTMESRIFMADASAQTAVDVGTQTDLHFALGYYNPSWDAAHTLGMLQLRDKDVRFSFAYVRDF